jgi:two-component system, NarL family, sensor histidine kinase UhpB
VSTRLASLPDPQVSMAAVASGSPGLDETRSWLARELHDGAVQRLTGMVVEIELLKRRGDLSGDLDHIQQAARESITDLRRLLCDLREQPAVETRFVQSVRDQANEFARTSGIEAEVSITSCPDEITYNAAVNLRRVLGEALTNVRRHSDASRVTVTLQVVDDALALTVADNGGGMETIDGGSGFGLRGMRERALLLGGRLSMDGAPGRGTTVRCIVPLGRLR